MSIFLFLIMVVVAGMIVGLYFRVLTLLPAFVFAAIGVGMSSHGLTEVVLLGFGAVVLLHVGYVAGCVLGSVARTHLSAHMPYRFPKSKVAH